MSAHIKPLELFLTKHAQRDLLEIAEDARHRIKDDITRLSRGELPSLQLKKLRGFTPPIWQLTSGRFRVLYRREREHLLILRVVAKPDQRDLFRSLR